MKTTVVSLACTLALTVGATIGHAETGGEAVQPLQEPAKTRSESTATALAVGGSLLGPVLVATAIMEGDSADNPLHAAFWPMFVAGGASVVLGPSIGNWYAGKVGSTGLNLRLGGAVVAAAGTAMMLDGFRVLDHRGNGAEFTAGAVVGVAGLGVIAAGTVLDVLGASDAAAVFNREHHGMHVALAPLVLRAGNAHETGLAMMGTF